MIKRRHHSPEFKKHVVAESNRRGASVAGVALAHGINANQLHKWRRALLRAKAAATRNTLLAVSVERALRTVAIGRKNYLFAGSDAGGERAAAIY